MHWSCDIFTSAVILGLLDLLIILANNFRLILFRLFRGDKVAENVAKETFFGVFLRLLYLLHGN